MVRYLFLLVFAISLNADEDFINLVESSHTFCLEDPDSSFGYTAITGKFPVDCLDTDKTPPGIFFIAYFKDGEENRPITFVFPGGPGGSCGPEAICTFGPRRLLTPDEGKSLLPPYRIIDNPETLLVWTDLVFVDPVGTGLSTFGEDENAVRDLLGIEGDIIALGDFVHTFIAFFNRWDSPKYLSGTSYGTVRCSGIAHYLTVHDFSLHGLILLGSALDYSTLIGQHNRSLPDSLMLPTFAASAWYHGRLWPEKSLDEVIEYARRFTFDSYIPALLQPNGMGKEEQSSFYRELSELTGLDLETVCRYQGRFDEFLYTTEFFGKERKVIGGLDTRYIGDLSSVRRKNSYDDPSYRDMQGLHCAFNSYLRNELETARPFEPYVAFSSPAFKSWNYCTHDSIELPDLVQRVRKTLIRNPEMRIFVGSGYYDCRTPFAATEYCFDHIDLPPSYRDNFLFEYYEAGHGFVFDHACLKKLKKDLRRLYQ